MHPRKLSALACLRAFGEGEESMINGWINRKTTLRYCN